MRCFFEVVPRCPQDAPKTPQDALKTPPRCPKRPPRRPRARKMEPKWSLVGTKIASKIDLNIKKAKSSRIL